VPFGHAEEEPPKGGGFGFSTAAFLLGFFEFKY